MNVEIPTGLLLTMILLNLILLIGFIIGFVNLKAVYRELKSQLLKN
jgi:hypothetical protein